MMLGRWVPCHPQDSLLRPSWHWRPIWTWCFLLSLTGSSALVDAWNPSSSSFQFEKVETTTNLREVSRTTFLSNIVSTGTTSLLLFVSPNVANAASTSMDGSDNNVDDRDDFVRSITQSLTPATKERPPITLPNSFQSTMPTSSSSNNNSINTPSSRKLSSPPNRLLPPPQRVEALITLDNPQQRPSPSDLLVLQVYESPQCQQLLGGARVPIAKLRFPIQVQLTSANALSSSTTTSTSSSLSGVELWNTLTSSQDLWIVATVCPEMTLNDSDGTSSTTGNRSEIGTTPKGRGNTSACPSQETFRASGISKFLTNLPGLDLPQDTIRPPGIRLPATLALQQHL